MNAKIICELDEQQCHDSCEHKGRRQFCPSNKNRVPEPVNTLQSQITHILTTGIQGTPDGYFIHGAIDSLVELVEKEAVGFGEWLDVECYRDGQHEWKYRGDNYANRYTTKELYIKNQEEGK